MIVSNFNISFITKEKNFAAYVRSVYIHKHATVMEAGQKKRLKHM